MLYIEVMHWIICFRIRSVQINTLKLEKTITKFKENPKNGASPENGLRYILGKKCTNIKYRKQIFQQVYQSFLLERIYHWRDIDFWRHNFEITSHHFVCVHMFMSPHPKSLRGSWSTPNLVLYEVQFFDIYPPTKKKKKQDPPKKIQVKSLWKNIVHIIATLKIPIYDIQDVMINYFFGKRKK